MRAHSKARPPALSAPAVVRMMDTAPLATEQSRTSQAVASLESNFLVLQRLLRLHLDRPAVDDFKPASKTRFYHLCHLLCAGSPTAPGSWSRRGSSVRARGAIYYHHAHPVAAPAQPQQRAAPGALSRSGARQGAVGCHLQGALLGRFRPHDLCLSAKCTIATILLKTNCLNT